MATDKLREYFDDMVVYKDIKNIEGTNHFLLGIRYKVAIYFQSYR